MDKRLKAVAIIAGCVVVGVAARQIAVASGVGAGWTPAQITAAMLLASVVVSPLVARELRQR